MTTTQLADSIRHLLRTEGAEHPRDLPPPVRAELTLLAAELGEDWCQSLYHAAVFMTRIA